jgi:hypothetical protein
MMRLRERALKLVSVVFLFLIFVESPTLAKPDAFEEVATALGGPGARDCGVVGLGGSRTKVDECVVHAFGSGDPFHARFNVLGIDSSLSKGILRAMSGRIYFLRFDSDQGGGSGMGSSVFLWL